MSKPKSFLAVFILVVTGMQNVLAQNEYSHPDNLSMLTAVPRGCLEITPSLLAAPNGQVLIDGTVQQDVLNVRTNAIEQVTVRIRLWRYGCHDPNRSAIMINLSLPEGVPDELRPDLNMNPIVTLRDGKGPDISLTSSLWQADWSAIFGRAIGYFGYAGSSRAFPNGVTYVLDTSTYGVAPSDFDEVISRYNTGGQLRLNFTGTTVTADIPPYNSSFDLPQQPKPTFTGRMTGQWVAGNLPATGLLLQLGEVPKQNRNFIFAIWFTYIDGQPVWMAANKDIPVGTNEVTLDMGYFEGGKLFTTPGGFNSGDVSGTNIGTMTLRVINCNEIEATTNFSSSGLGSNTLRLERLIRIAGYDCDGTQAIK